MLCAIATHVGSNQNLSLGRGLPVDWLYMTGRFFFKFLIFYLFLFFLLVLSRYNWHTALYKVYTWPSNSTPGYLSEENENTNWKDICTPMFIAAWFTILFTIAKIWKWPSCLSTDEWIKKMCYLYIYINYTYNGILLSLKK